MEIIQECKDKGVTVTCSKHGIYPATYYYWKKKLLVHSDLRHGNTRKNRSRIKALEKEVQALKLLLAEEKLQSRLKDELLEKKYPELRRS